MGEVGDVLSCGLYVLRWHAQRIHVLDDSPSAAVAVFTKMVDNGIERLACPLGL